MSLNIPASMITYANDLVHKAVMICSVEYGFDSTEALRLVGVVGVEEVKVKVSKPKVKEEKEDKGFRGAFPLPYNGIVDENCCHGLKHTYGLFTQCKSASKGTKYCKTCQNQADKNDNGVPTCGDIESRSAVDIMEYVDPKGRTTVAYREVLKKLNLSMEDALGLAAKIGMTINEVHLLGEETSEETEPVRKEKGVKVMKEKEKKGKGRPKKAEKVLELEESDDLFSSLVSAANQPVKKLKEPVAESSEDIEEVVPKAVEVAKVSKESKVAKAVEVPKVTKVAKEVEELEEEEVEEEEEEEDEVVRIVYQGKKYLRSENTGVVYNDDDEQDVVGCWNRKTKKIDFDEEEE